MTKKTEEKLEGEIKRAFALERMILFSDAVFAIVITLMAIDIKLPEQDSRYAEDAFLHNLKILLPTLLAYAVSFFFIGMTWYRHLQIFDKVKNYDKGLVIFNLIMLFWIGLFPFGVSLVSHPNSILLPYIIYFIILLLSTGSQILLQRYLYSKSEKLLQVRPTKEDKAKLRLGIILLALFSFAVIASAILYQLISNPEAKPAAMLLLLIVPVGRRIFGKSRRIKVTE